MSERLQQLQQRFGEVNFISSHHNELSKSYLRESVLLEQAIHQEQANIKAQQEADQLAKETEVVADDDSKA